jgi:hypothetical protein
MIGWPYQSRLKFFIPHGGKRGYPSNVCRNQERDDEQYECKLHGLNGITTAVTEPPPIGHDIKTRVTGGFG